MGWCVGGGWLALSQMIGRLSLPVTVAMLKGILSFYT